MQKIYFEETYSLVNIFLTILGIPLFEESRDLRSHPIPSSVHWHLDHVGRFRSVVSLFLTGYGWTPRLPNLDDYRVPVKYFNEVLRSTEASDIETGFVKVDKLHICGPEMTCERLPTARAGVGPVHFTNSISPHGHTSKCHRDLKLISSFARKSLPHDKFISPINSRLPFCQLLLSWD